MRANDYSILFLGHDASKTGAPLVLFNLIKWLKTNHPNFKISLLLLREGELSNNFKNIVDHYISIPDENLFNKLKRSLALKSERRENEKYLRIIDLAKDQLIYANTVETIALAVSLKKENKALKIISHIHELEVTLKLLQPNFEDYSKEIDLFICPSELVANNLISNYNIEKERLTVIYEFVENSEVISSKEKIDRIFRVGASGTFHWRKGGDIFLLLAHYIHLKYPKYTIEFVWIGRVPEAEKIIIEADLSKLGLKDKVSFTGLLEIPQEEYTNLDVFVLTSREDPFPLVCIEVGMLGVPIICFEKATGTCEILSKGGGFIVPYLDIPKMAERVITYFENEELKSKHGEENRSNFSHFTVEKVCPQIFKKIQLVSAID